MSECVSECVRVSVYSSSDASVCVCVCVCVCVRVCVTCQVEGPLSRCISGLYQGLMQHCYCVSIPVEGQVVWNTHTKTHLPMPIGKVCLHCNFAISTMVHESKIENKYVQTCTLPGVGKIGRAHV